MKLNFPETVSRRLLPVNYLDKDKKLFSKELEKIIPEFNSVNYEDCTFYTDFRLYSKCKLILLPGFKDKKNNNLKVKLKDLRKKKVIFKKAILFVDNWSCNYFHWFTDVLPKLYLLSIDNYGVPVILPKYFTKYTYITESLKLFPEIKIFWLAEYQKAKISKLIFIPNLATTGNYNDVIIRRLNVFLKEKLSVNKIEAKERVFISREKAPTRKILNWKESVEVLKKHNLKMQAYEDLCWSHQIELTSQSELLIGVHGAGLTNMLFMEPGSTIIELRKKDDCKNNCFFSLASALNHKYYYLLCEVDNEHEITQKNNFYVNLVDLDKLLTLILKT